MASFDTFATPEDVVNETDKAWVIRTQRADGTPLQFQIPCQFGEWKVVNGAPHLFCRSWFARKVGLDKDLAHLTDPLPS